MNLHNYSYVVINTSGGKDSICAIERILRMAKVQDYSKENIILSHQDLGRMEWGGTLDLVKIHAEFFGLQLVITKRVNNKGYNETLLEYVKRRGKWPSNKQRYCTSDYKRAPGAKVVTHLQKKPDMKVLYVFGFRKDESPARSKKESCCTHKALTTKSRLVTEYLPIHNWSIERVWKTIKSKNIPYHYAYDLGMPRLSCVFCIFSPPDALVIAGYANPELLDEYIEVEDAIKHTFRSGFSLHEIKEKINVGYKPKAVSNWVM